MEEQEEYEQQNFFEEMNNENKDLQNKNFELNRAMSSAAFNEQEEGNLIQYQLETDKILERIEHFLKGDKINFSDGGSYYTEPTKKILVIVKEDKKNGIKYYIQELKKSKKGTEEIAEVLVKLTNSKNEEVEILEEDSDKILKGIKGKKLTNLGYNYVEILDEEKKPFNEYGVSELMRIISMYVTKETFLSFYKEERICEILSDLGNALNDFLYCNYEKMGMDTKFKESKYILMSLNIFHTIESCYRRAIDGGEQENIRTRSIVSQSINQSGGQQNGRVIKPKWNPLKPSTW